MTNTDKRYTDEVQRQQDERGFIRDAVRRLVNGSAVEIAQALQAKKMSGAKAEVRITVHEEGRNEFKARWFVA